MCCVPFSGHSDSWGVSELGGEGQQEIGASQTRRTRPGGCIRSKEMKVGVKLFLEMKLTGTADGSDGRDL